MPNSTPVAPKKNTPAQVMKRVQLLHLWLGTLFAPLIIFFSLSGALQTLGLHESEAGGSAPAWIAQIASVHKNQKLLAEKGEAERPEQKGEGERPEQKAKPVASGSAPDQQKAGAPAGDERDKDGESKAARGPSPWPLKWFVVLMSVGLIITTALGIWMAFKYSKNKAVVWGLLAAGVLLPIALLFL